MNLKSKVNKKSALIFIIICMSVATILFSINQLINLEQMHKKGESFILNTASEDNFDPLKFWNKEMARVNDTDLNLKFLEDHELSYTNPYTQEKYNFEAKELEFDSPNWVDAKEDTITLHGYLIYPEQVNLKNPACLCMHGLNGNANASFNMAYPYLEEGFIVLCHDHPGHGKSGGAQPSPENFYPEGEYNESAHFYLTLCGAIQGLRLLESQTTVNTSQILVTGGSYGALNTMWLSSVCGERIAGAIPYIAIGDLKKNLADPTKLLYWVWDTPPEEIPDSFWDEQARWFDPKYYLSSEKLPPIMWQIGTNDEFFIHTGINGTFDAVSHEDKFLQIYPNGHHGLPNWENTTKFFINYVLNGGDSPPEIDVKDPEKKFGWLGDTLKIEVEVESQEEIQRVQVAYRYLDILGSCWELLDLDEEERDTWTGTINPGIISSEVHYYIIVTLKGKEHVWFSSKIQTPGILISNLTVPFYIILVAFIGLPFVWILRRRYQTEKGKLEREQVEEWDRKFKIESISLGITNAVFFLSLILPWVVLEKGGVMWTHLYVFNNLYTWTLLFGMLATYMTPLFFIGWFITSHLSFSRPMLSGILKIWYPLFVSLIFAVVGWGFLITEPDAPSLNFGAVYPGIGLFVMLGACIAFFLIGIWKRRYQTKLGLREAKNKWYNIDRWFKIHQDSQQAEKKQV